MVNAHHHCQCVCTTPQSPRKFTDASLHRSLYGSQLISLIFFKKLDTRIFQNYLLSGPEAEEGFKTVREW